MTAGLTIRFVPLRLPAPIVKYGGSMVWAVMIHWIITALLPSLRPLFVAFISAALTLTVEFFKLHHSPALDAFGLTIPGILLLGRIFSGWDIFAYWVAIFLEFMVDKRIHPTLKLRVAFLKQTGFAEATNREVEREINRRN